MKRAPSATHGKSVRRTISLAGAAAITICATAGGIYAANNSAPTASASVNGQKPTPASTKASKPATASGTPAEALKTASAPATPFGTWWSPGEDRPLPTYVEYDNEFGRVGVVNTDGTINTKGHPFFEPLGTNGRACVSCHQPSDGMSLSVRSIQERWRVTGGTDPIFASIDGKNCPILPSGDPKSHSLLLDRGLFRVALPWPPKTPNTLSKEAEFTLEVVNDPTGCNTDAKYGIQGEAAQVSVFRRPRVMANMRFILDSVFPLFNVKDGSPMARDPETGKVVSMQLMSDARLPTLKTQAVDAAATHLQMLGKLSPQQLTLLEKFQLQIYTAQSFSKRAGRLDDGGPEKMGPLILSKSPYLLGDNFEFFMFGNFDAWRGANASKDPAERAFRQSVARGHDVFFVRPFWMRDVTHINTIGLGNPIKRSCATCHNSSLIGNDTAPGQMDLGTTTLPWARTANDALDTRQSFAHAYDQDPHGVNKRIVETRNRVNDLPLFKLTCKPTARPHPFLGRVIYTTDPGRALITGRCTDIGAITIQQMRGLAARAPYFSNGAAKNLRELVEFYDRRFEAQYSEQEKEDLINFLSTL